MTTEIQEALTKLETIVEKLENLSLQQQAADPKRQKVVDEVITEARDAVEEIVRWQRNREHEAQLVAVIDAIEKNTATTNKLLSVSEQRLSQIEQELTEQDGTLPQVDPAILAEAAFLKRQLAGVAGTEGPGPLFKDAPTIVIPAGLDVLAAAVNSADTYTAYPTS